MHLIPTISRCGLFTLDPKHLNHIALGKRPYHTIIPAFVMKDGKPWLSFGVMGGDQQPQGHVRVGENLRGKQRLLSEIIG